MRASVFIVPPETAGTFSTSLAERPIRSKKAFGDLQSPIKGFKFATDFGGLFESLKQQQQQQRPRALRELTAEEAFLQQENLRTGVAQTQAERERRFAEDVRTGRIGGPDQNVGQRANAALGDKGLEESKKQTTLLENIWEEARKREEELVAAGFSG